MRLLPSSFRFRPRLIDALRGYDRATLLRDLGAGVTVGVVALPLAMAFAIASGARPEAGIFTAIIAGFLISALGGSRVQIGGPAGAYIVIVYGIVAHYGLGKLLVATLMAGFMLFAMGFFRLGALIRYVPTPIISGFTNGIAVLIALSQLKDFLGLEIERMPADFFGQLQTLASHAHGTNVAALALAIGSLLLLFAWPGIARRSGRAQRLLSALPASILVLACAMLIATLLGLQIPTIASRFGGIPQGLPGFAIPGFDFALIQEMFAPALTIAVLGAIESLLCARIADNLIEDRHDPNQELMAQGIANLASPLFGGLPATGTIARTFTNIRSGGATPVAGIIHALVLLAIVWVAAPLAGGIPLAALAAILVYVALNMGEWREFAHLRRYAPGYRAQFLSTFVLTVAVDLTIAVQIGLVLACVFFLHRMSGLTKVVPILEESLALPLPANTTGYALSGSFFFGSADRLEFLFDVRDTGPRIVILDLSGLIDMDETGLDALEALRRRLVQRGGRLLLAGPAGQALELMRRSGFLVRLGADALAETIEEAATLAARA
jgi:SulP family sulfate permease